MTSITKRVSVLSAAIVLAAIAAATVAVFFPSLVAVGQSVPPGSGVKLQIVSAAIPADRKPVVTFNLTDERGTPIRLADVDEGGLRFLIASLQADADGITKYVNYVVANRPGADFTFEGQTRKPALASATQAGVDTGGVFTDLGSGRFTYKFAVTLPANFDAGTTHAIGGYATRGARASVSNDAFYFVPSGAAVTLRREVVVTSTCNNCHDNLAAHGGTRRDTRVCILCHTAQTVDPETANTVEFKVMVHKIHSGARLPSVAAGGQYVIIGNRQNVFDFSGIVWPQDTRNCQTCHAGAAQGDNFKTKPSAQACGSCHDDVDFATGKNHAGGAQPTNANCAACHTADGPEFGLSVAGAHTIPEKSKQLRGVNFEIVSVSNTKPGQSPTVVFNIKDDAGNQINPSEMASFSLLLAGPTTDYANVVSENAVGATTTADGKFSYTFTAKIPADAKGSYAIGTQGYLNAQVKDPAGNLVSVGTSTTFRDVGFNKVSYVAVTDAKAQPRKQVVDINRCNVCHETLALHGGTRQNTELCIFCHNPNGTDVVKRTSAKGPMPPESITFNGLIHRIHTGEEQQTKPYIIFGGSPSSPGPINLSEARFPTDRRNCTKCHVPGSNLLAFLRPGIQPTTVTQGNTIVSQTGAIQTICMGCHDGSAAKAHADTQTAGSPTREACLVCHNEGREQAVSKVHAQ